jgi:hypothetical protein
VIPPLSLSEGIQPMMIGERLLRLEARVNQIEDTLEWFNFKGVRRFWGALSLMLWAAQRLSLHFNSSSEALQWLRHYFC